MKDTILNCSDGTILQPPPPPRPRPALAKNPPPADAAIWWLAATPADEADRLLAEGVPLGDLLHRRLGGAGVRQTHVAADLEAMRPDVLARMLLMSVLMQATCPDCRAALSLALNYPTPGLADARASILAAAHAAASEIRVA